MIPSKEENPVHGIPATLISFLAPRHCLRQPARNEPATTSIPDSIRMHKRTTENDYPRRKSISQASRIFREWAKVWRMLFFLHFTGERAEEVQSSTS
ncbi:hypothetical protein CEXT_637741 [Caerostris extrusa]|uniref:Uncharacterized protein n=1 Tax=Caerostris extrusa TaxID=172846 RepID=A0AAV4MHM8_CAEEX|nr:hypothetical protein CEXT_637741 [Caerostris extrusa]